MKRCTVLGDGSWGTAVATALAHNGHRVNLWCYNPHVAASIAERRCNDIYLPGVILDPLIRPYHDMNQALEGAEFVFQAIPMQFLRTTLAPHAASLPSHAVWVHLTKGIERGTGLFADQVVRELIGRDYLSSICGGPNFAQELAQKHITAATVAAGDCAIVDTVSQVMSSSYVKIYGSVDTIGVQVGGALKNVIALAVGMLDGAGYTENAKALVLTRGLKEMVMLAKALGGNERTLYGLSGMGDLVLTAMGGLSKNMRVGKAIGQGKTLTQVLQETGLIPEGVNTAYALGPIIEKKQISMPIVQTVLNVLNERSTCASILETILLTPYEYEC